MNYKAYEVKLELGEKLNEILEKNNISDIDFFMKLEHLEGIDIDNVFTAIANLVDALYDGNNN